MAPNYALLFTLTYMFTTCSSHASFKNQQPITIKATIMHRNSKQSPLHDPTATENDIFEKDLDISRKRANYFFHTYESIESSTTVSNAEIIEQSFIMHFKIGTPPVDTYGYIDTASSLSWLQCVPCTYCYKQFGTVYSTEKSSSYRNIPWEHRMCSATAIGVSVYNVQDKCSYRVNYRDRTVSGGYIAEETFTFDDKIVRGIMFGCSNYNVRNDYKPPGLIGLGRFSVSLVQQLTASHFSYYLEHNEVNSNMVGVIDIGTPAIDRRAQIPLLPSENDSYLLQWKNIRIDGDPIKVPCTFFESGIVIDTGSAYTLLPQEVLDPLTEAIIDKMGRPLLDYMPRICYKSIRKAPRVIFEFVNYNMSLCESNAWRRVEGRTFCLAIYENSHGSGSIFGMYQQRNKRVAFDLHSGHVSMIDINGECPLIE